MLGGRFRLGLLAEHQQVLVYGLVRGEFAACDAQVLPSKGSLLGQRTKRCEDVGLLQRCGHARVTLNREGYLGKLRMALGNHDSMVSMLFCLVRRSQNCEKCFGRSQRKATQSPSKATPKPP